MWAKEFYREGEVIWLTLYSSTNTVPKIGLYERKETKVIDLKIDKEFQEKIPPLTGAEFDQLRENILADGEVYEPIVTWNGTIVDGHNRWKIIQENPGLPYKVKEMDFQDKWDAFDWMYRKQLGRRNLTNEQKTYLLGKLYEARKNSVGAPKGNANASKQSSQNGNIDKSSGRVGEIIAKEQGVGHGTVLRAADFAKGLDAIREVSEEAADKILTGKSKATKAAVGELKSASAEAIKQVASDILANKPIKPKGYTKADREDRAITEAIVAEMYDTSTIQEATIETLLDDIVLNAAEYIRVLKNTLIDHSTLLTPENKPIVAKAIQDNIINEIVKLKGIVER